MYFKWSWFAREVIDRHQRNFSEAIYKFAWLFMVHGMHYHNVMTKFKKTSLFDCNNALSLVVDIRHGESVWKIHVLKLSSEEATECILEITVKRKSDRLHPGNNDCATTGKRAQFSVCSLRASLEVWWLLGKKMALKRSCCRS